ncbi:MAG: rhamnulokinase [Chloroflexota bacterium]|nr:rhamnulokinase [Chloroflexota bacterium]MDE2947700.1 rhamnulokinase [Chloroflexota bacterium]
MTAKHVIAIDLGATSGRVMDAAFDGERLHLSQIHRFPNVPVQTPTALHWDVLRLWHEITVGIGAASEAASIGLDCWGVDYALLDSAGELLANPYHYRDPRTDGAMEWVFERMPRREIFARTGIQFMPLNALYQLAAGIRDGSPLLEQAASMLTIADLFNYWLTGSKTCEFTEATTMQLYNPALADWDREIMAAVGIPSELLTPIVEPGARIGQYQGIDVILPACHDTGSAVVAVPSTEANSAYLSSGTWSLLGLELAAPILSDAAYEANVTNEGGYGGSWRLLKNIMGLWLVDQCRATWRAAGVDYSYAQLTAMVREAAPFKAFIEPDDPSFLPPGDMPARVIDYCRRTGQPAPESDADIMATVYISLAYKYRCVLEQLIDVSGQAVDKLHIIGGGAQNALLNQMTANATGRPVIAGPVEATATGNAIAQLIALGELGGVAEARAMLSGAGDLLHFEPQDSAEWDAHYGRFRALLE